MQIAAPFCTVGHGVHVVDVKHPVAGVLPAQTPAQECSIGPHVCPPELVLLDELLLDELLLLDALLLDALLDELLFVAPPMPPKPPVSDSPPSPPPPSPGPAAVAQPPPSHAPNPSATTTKPSRRFVLTTYLRARCSPVFPVSGSFTDHGVVVDEPRRALVRRPWRTHDAHHFARAG